MAGNLDLPPGAFLTNLDGRRCTAIPRAKPTTSPQPPAAPGATTPPEVPPPPPPPVDIASSTTASTSTTTPAPSPIPPSTKKPKTKTKSKKSKTSSISSTSSTSTSSSSSSSSTSTSSSSSTSTSPSSLTSTPSTNTTSSTAKRNPTSAPPRPTSHVTVGSATPTSPVPLVTTPATTPTTRPTTGPSVPIAPTVSASPAHTESPTDPAGIAAPNSDSATRSTAVIAGGVIGGVIAVSVLAFAIWWWRRRLLKRRSSLLTPLTIPPSFERDEKGGLMDTTRSGGQMQRGAKFKAALARVVHNAKVPDAPSAKLNRGFAQSASPEGGHRREGSAAMNGRGGEVTVKNRFVHWWSRLAADVSFNSRLHDKTPVNNRPYAGARGGQERSPDLGRQPDFLTLLCRNNGELDRDVQRRRTNTTQKHGGSAGSISSADHLLGSPVVEDPFSDVHAFVHNSATPAPLVVSRPDNPFSDANATPKPTTYVADIRRSRGLSVSSREGVAAMETFEMRRDKFRSDPFDLEIREPSGGSAGRPVLPRGAHVRTESFTSKISSKYSSGITMADWSDPGPDVGVGRSTTRGPEERASSRNWRNRADSAMRYW